MQIKFGMDGWSGVISRECNFENLCQIAQALASYLSEEGQVAGGVVVGYDTRFLSDSYALEMAKVLAGNGIRTYLSTKPVIVPAVSYSVLHLQAAAGLMITAGHQPYQYNGVKIRGSHGGPALADMLVGIERQLGRGVKMTTADDELITRFNPDELYLKGIVKVVDLDLIKQSGIKVIVDVMHGAARGYFRELLQSEKNQVLEIRNSENLSFGGNSPEPIPTNLDSLVNVLAGFNADLALAIDCDGDRLGVIDQSGRFIDAHQIFTLLLKHLVENRKMDGMVVKSYSITHLVNRQAEKYQLKLHETPVGFGPISERFLNEKILLGGEESGGFCVQGHVPERDAILAGLLLLEMVAMSKRSITQILDEIEEEFGKYIYRKLEVNLTGARPGFTRSGVRDGARGRMLDSVLDKTLSSTSGSGAREEFSRATHLSSGLLSSNSLIANSLCSNAFCTNSFFNKVSPGNSLLPNPISFEVAQEMGYILEEMAGFPVERVEYLDGTKYVFKSGSWLLARPAGSTHEPLMRYYAEGSSIEEVEKILQVATSIGIV